MKKSEPEATSADHAHHGPRKGDDSVPATVIHNTGKKCLNGDSRLGPPPSRQVHTGSHDKATADQATGPVMTRRSQMREPTRSACPGPPDRRPVGPELKTTERNSKGVRGSRYEQQSFSQSPSLGSEISHLPDGWFMTFR